MKKSSQNLFQKLFIFATSGLILVATNAVFSPVKADSLTIKEKPMILASKPASTTMTVTGKNTIAVSIKDAEFKFNGTLKRTSGNYFIAEDRQVRVMYDKGTSHVVIINKITGTEFYNYIFSIANEGSL
jgi:hypothetical protein